MSQAQIKFTNPNRGNFARNIMYASALGYPMTEKDRHPGSTAVIVGSGPSLNNEKVRKRLRALYKNPKTIFYGCKAALRWLDNHHMRPTYGVSIDPGAHIACEEKIPRVEGVIHIMASVTAPEVFEYLEGENVEIFHSVCGLDQELDLYETLTGCPDFMQGGYNVINRALAVAQYHGADRFIFAGADSGWRTGDSVYYNPDLPFRQKKVFMQDKGLVDGQVWESTPDMVASAVALARFAKEWDVRGEPWRIEFIGDVMPAALRNKSEEFLQTVAS